MGVGYAASALHRISYLIIDETAPHSTEPPPGWFPEIPGARYIKGPLRFRSPATADVIAWRDRLASKYQSQLGELLTWDEGSDYSESADAATGEDLLFRYVAAVFDRDGTEGVRALVGTSHPGHEKLGPVFNDVHRRGLTSRFPQLLLVSKFWLPFQRNMIIEEPDWEGRTECFGSSYRLAEELKEVRQAIASADPHATEWDENRDAPTEVLHAAWHASETIARMCAVATARQLPLWCTT